MVDQVRNYADPRLLLGCVYCGGPDETKDHVPSRVFLDPPFPSNLPVIGACRACNLAFSLDEEYVACLIEAMATGSTSLDGVERAEVAAILRRSPSLRSRIEASRDINGSFVAESGRVRNVILKLARGHAAYELSTPCRAEPSEFSCRPLKEMTDEELDSFDAAHVTHLIGEVGSRGTQRLLVTQALLKSTVDGHHAELGLLVNDWVDVQDGRYRYLAIDDMDGIRIKIVLRDYLTCEVAWAK